MPEIMIFSGNASQELTKNVAEHLNLPIGKALVGRFSDGESMVEIQENVRGRDVFIIQSTCAPSNDNLMELILLADALRRASATKITADAFGNCSRTNHAANIRRNNHHIFVSTLVDVFQHNRGAV
ncbi:MAG: ribose-phosphate pyrophosphokinase-like domain-containing protein, partial [Gammaproteobacteria bacterium]|nr:ribose-phosphate pyrophosphokinase-like domain-containing protein [Gammaproteobacteria bacterium]